MESNLVGSQPLSSTSWRMIKSTSGTRAIVRKKEYLGFVHLADCWSSFRYHRCSRSSRGLLGAISSRDQALESLCHHDSMSTVSQLCKNRFADRLITNSSPTIASTEPTSPKTSCYSTTSCARSGAGTEPSSLTGTERTAPVVPSRLDCRFFDDDQQAPSLTSFLAFAQ